MSAMAVAPSGGESAMSKYYSKKLSDLTTVSLDAAKISCHIVYACYHIQTAVTNVMNDSATSPS